MSEPGVALARARYGIGLCAWLGLTHGLSDAAAGFLLFGGNLAPERAAALLLLYNLIAFALQPAAGWLIDEARQRVFGLEPPALATLAGLLLSSLGLALSACQPGQAVLSIALGSACFHTGAGALALKTPPAQRGAGLALFTAPGALGLALGSAAAIQGLTIGPVLIAGLVAMALGVNLYRKTPSGPDEHTIIPDISPIPPLLSHRELLLLLLLLAIALRSFFWSGTQLLMAARVDALLWLGAGASLGKLAGGPLGSRFGWRFAASGSLLAAALLSTESLPLLVLGVAALQSSTPLLLDALAARLPRYPATAAGLGLGLAIALGGSPLFLLPHVPPPSALWPLLFLVPFLLWPGLVKWSPGREKCMTSDVIFDGPAPESPSR